MITLEWNMIDGTEGEIIDSAYDQLDVYGYPAGETAFSWMKKLIDYYEVKFSFEGLEEMEELLEEMDLEEAELEGPNLKVISSTEN